MSFLNSRFPTFLSKSLPIMAMIVGLMLYALPCSAIKAANSQPILPLYFEKNEGQIDSSVLYRTRATGYSLFFTSQEIVVALNEKEQEQSAVRIKLIGSNPSPTIQGIEEQEYKTHYFIGPSKSWKTNISNYAKVLYENVYPGIDAVFYGNSGQMEYDFFIKPGADPADIRFQISGSENLSIDATGRLRISTKNGKEMFMQQPFVYQSIEEKRTEIPGSFCLFPDNVVGFNVGSYDITLPLIIDPVLRYSSYLGGSGADSGRAVTVDSNGNAYYTGQTDSINFPVTAGVFQTGNPGGTSAYVTKLNPTGTALLYSTYLGGSALDVPRGITIDASGNAYITGRTQSSDFPVTAGAFQTTLIGTTDAFITKLNPSGSALIYSTYLGASPNQSDGGKIAIDSTGNAYIVGFTSSPNFPTTPGAFQSTLNGISDAFITKINPSGTALIYSTYLGGSGTDNATDLSLDAAGNVYLAGVTTSPNFPVTPGAFQTTYGGGTFDAFITKLNSTGTNLIYSTFLGGTGSDSSTGLTADSVGNVYVTGATTSTDFPVTAGAFQTTLPGSTSIFVTKLNSTGTSLIYSTYLGGSDNTQTRGIKVDASGNAYVTGQTFATDYPVTPDAFQNTFGGTADAFFTILSPTGSSLVYSTYLGGSLSDTGAAIAVDNNSCAYIIGNTSSTNFPVTPGSFQTTYGGGSSDSFCIKFANTTSTSLTVLPNPSTFGQSVTLTGSVTPSTATGTISFFDGATLIGTSPVVAGSAGFSTSAFTVGTHSLTAVYSGDTDFTGSTSSPITLTVDPALLSTTTTLTASPDPLVFEESVTLTGFVLPATATGTVSFFDGTTLIGTSPVIGGSSVFSTSNFTVGIHSLTAVYSGDITFASSTSPAILLSVNPAPVSVFAPTDLKGRQKENRFLTQTDLVNILTWKAPVEGNPPVYYRIYRNSLNRPIATVRANRQLSYSDHDRKKGKTTVYYVVSVDEFGNASIPAIIRIPDSTGSSRENSSRSK